VIGNDLIDLSTWPQVGAERLERYRRKVFQEAERGLLAQWPKPLAWQNALGWSLKEAAYKAHYRTGKDRIFAPLSLRIESLEKEGDTYQGWLCVEGAYYQLYGEQRGGLLHSLAWKAGSPSPAWQLQVQRPGHFWHQGKCLRFYKDEAGAPWVASLDEGRDYYRPASLSHDGGRHAWAWQG
jgi:hypothetical protein